MTNDECRMTNQRLHCFHSSFVTRHSSVFDVLDENHLVAPFIVDQLIHQLMRNKNAESSCAHSPLFSNNRMTKQVAAGIADCSVLQLRQVEPLARIFNSIDDCTLQTDVADRY